MRISIHLKITVLIAVVTGFVLFASHSYLYKDLTDRTYARVFHNLLREVFLTRDYLEEHLIYHPKDLSEMTAFASRVKANIGARVTIVDMAGAVMGDSDISSDEILLIENHLYRPEIQDALSHEYGYSRRFSTSVKMDMLYVAVKFQSSGHDAGFIRLSLPLTEVQEVSRNLAGSLQITLIFGLLAALILGFGMSYIVSARIQRMSFVARSIAYGNFDQKLSFESRDEIGDLAKAVNYMSDQIKEKIDEVIESRSRLEAVFLNMIEGVMVVDERGAIVLMNQTLKNFLDVDLPPQGKRPIEVIRNVTVQEIVDCILARHKAMESREIKILLPDGQKDLLVNASPVNREGSVQGVVLVFHDITEIRRLEKVRQDFVANVSHELRTPLSTIKGYAETLIDGALEDPVYAKDFLNVISADADRLAKLISDLLELSRIESGKMELTREACSLKELLERVLLVLKRQIKENRIVITKEIDPDMPLIETDPTSLAQVFFNIIENAIKYNVLHGTIHIAASRKEHQVEISIKDSGIGIPKEEMSRIFERFYRVDKARSRQIGGTGLGLSIVKHLLEMLGGKVTVDSELGKGSTFTVILPLS